VYAAMDRSVGFVAEPRGGNVHQPAMLRIPDCPDEWTVEQAARGVARVAREC